MSSSPPHNKLRAARYLPFVARQSAISSMLRIVRSIGVRTITLTVSGRIGAEQLPELRRSVDEERGRDVVLDLDEVGLVNAETVRFLVQCETQGVRIARCPAYVR